MTTRVILLATSLSFGGLSAFAANPPPSITSQPVSANAVVAGQGSTPANSMAQFSVQAAGVNLSYRWFHDNLAMTGQTNNVLTLSTVTFADAGQYWAEVSNDGGAVTSQSAALSVLGITQQPQSVFVVAGTYTALSVSAVGPDLHYQWTRNGDVIPGAVYSLLVVSASASVVDSGAYQVIVFNSWGLAKSTNALAGVAAAALPFADNFASRGMINTVSGAGTGTSKGATKEAGEPQPCNGRVGKSVWVTWVAPASGIAIFDTSGSAFDTVLGVYTGTTVSGLVTVATDDDSGDFHASHVRFNAVAGSSYQIYVGSLDKDGGDIVLSWQLNTVMNPLPIIQSGPTNVTTLPGASATLSVNYTTVTPVVIQWYHNGVAMPGANQASLQWSQLTVADLGTYEVMLTSTEWTCFVPTAEIQFNSEGATKVGARQKLFDAVNSALTNP